MSVLDSFKRTFSLEDDYESFQDEVDAAEVSPQENNVIKPSFFKRREKETAGPAAIRPAVEEQAVNIIRPEAFDDAMAIVNEVRAGEIIVINTARMDLKSAQRLLDFVSGAAFALDGDIQEVMEAVYVVTPCGVSLKNSARTESVMKNLFGMK
ncbi:cell division protein SepF [Proteiniclasticum sp. QWL-01]|uniref:cell division protein SepF n=1 Tax=Proteiniclasticum sp. QWL-01 TaxID=3036945 RepID=UPI0024110C42|nr:cell division protein SepF [Proteiniclasticum sp. QWL-01]WFF74206.1 cell division protein SepF [Proteiniclasticum sp. QWL-01]